MIKVTGCEVIWLQATSYASVQIYELKRKPLNDELDKEDGPDDHVPYRYSLELLLLRDVGSTQYFGAVDCPESNVCESLKAELTRVHLVVSTTAEKVLDLSGGVLAFRDDL